MTAIIACGDRNWTDAATVCERLQQLPPDSLVIEGEARGADSLARDAARQLCLRVSPHPANWNQYHRAAGPIRNGEMLKELLASDDPDKLVIAFHDHIDKSRGTADMVKRARKAGVRVEIITSMPVREADPCTSSTGPAT